MDAGDAVVVLTTLPADADHAAFARALVDDRLAACVSVMPVMDSTYRWAGAVQGDRERQVLIKTTAARVPELARRLRLLHPYEVPEILVLAASGGAEAYLAWLRESTTPEL